jgi:hypothetical protein
MSKYGDPLYMNSGLTGAPLLTKMSQGISSGVKSLTESIPKVNIAKITGSVQTQGSYDANVVEIEKILEKIENKSLEEFESNDLKLVDDLERIYKPIVQARVKYLMEKSEDAAIASRTGDMRGLSAATKVNPTNQLKLAGISSLMTRIDSLISKVKGKRGEKYYSPNPKSPMYVEVNRLQPYQLTPRAYGGRKRKSRRRRAKITKRRKSRSKQKSKRRFR